MKNVFLVFTLVALFSLNACCQDAKEVPAAVKATLDNEFKAYKVEESELSETAKGKVYEFALRQGKEEMEVAINADGTVIKKEQAEEEDEDDE